MNRHAAATAVVNNAPNNAPTAVNGLLYNAYKWSFFGYLANYCHFSLGNGRRFLDTSLTPAIFSGKYLLW